jgi:hypothetical protein
MVSPELSPTRGIFSSSAFITRCLGGGGAWECGPQCASGEALCVLNWGVPSRKQSWMLKSKVLEDMCNDGLLLSKGG